jgi:NADH-quinone oxidoreductase subunit M
MNLDAHILTILLLTPLVGAIVLACLPERGKLQQWAALAVTLLTFAESLHLPWHYARAAAAGNFRFVQDLPWIAAPAIRYHLGVDGLGMWLVVLTTFLAPLGVLASWNAIATRTKLFYTLFLLQQVAMIGIFVALDLFLYYGFWELSLVPMTILIATFGRTKHRRAAAIKYFVYAFIRCCWWACCGCTRRLARSIFRVWPNLRSVMLSPAMQQLCGSVRSASSFRSGSRFLSFPCTDG